MVRHKSRWLLVRIDWETDVNCTSPGSNEIITARDIYLELRNLVQTVFGISGAAMTHDLQVRIYDAEARIAIIRISRCQCNLVRASLTLLTSLKKFPLVANVISLSGSARTAKMIALRELRKDMEMKLSESRRLGSLSKKMKKSNLLRLEERMDLVRGLD